MGNSEELLNHQEGLLFREGEARYLGLRGCEKLAIYSESQCWFRQPAVLRI
jgi:hypothetical protein